MLQCCDTIVLDIFCSLFPSITVIYVPTLSIVVFVASSSPMCAPQQENMAKPTWGLPWETENYFLEFPK